MTTCADRTAADAKAGTPPIRLLTLTTLFPNSRQPRHGIFVANRLRRMCDSGRVRATVVAAVPWFPGAYREAAAIPPADRAFGFDVRHPRYFQVPAVGMRVQPDSLARALLDDLRQGGLRAEAFDVVDAHYFYPDGVAAARIARELDLPLVISARGSDINLIAEIPFARRRMLEAARQADALIAVSSALAARMAEFGMPPERTHVFRNGVDMEMFFPMPRNEARMRLGLDARGAWVLCVGNLVSEKGFDLVIRAASPLADTRVLIVGQGPERSALVALAGDLMPGRAEFRDNMPQAELRLVYSACNVLALPSLREGWPNVLLESIACGTPVVASAVGGVPEIAGPGAPALLVSERGPQAWGVALRKLIDAALPPDDVRGYAARFGWEDVVSRQCDLYASVAAAHAAARHRSVA